MLYIGICLCVGHTTSLGADPPLSPSLYSQSTRLLVDLPSAVSRLAPSVHLWYYNINDFIKFNYVLESFRRFSGETTGRMHSLDKIGRIQVAVFHSDECKIIPVKQ